MQTFGEHVIERLGSYPLWNDVVIDHANEKFTFLLWSPDERLTGIQKYNWKKSKTKRNTGKYMSYTAKGDIALFGLEYIDYTKPIFIVEGCFDAISVRRAGFQAIALLSNTCNKATRRFLTRELTNAIAVCDGDKAGLKLATYTGGRKIILPTDEDPNSMELDKLTMLLKVAVERYIK